MPCLCPSWLTGSRRVPSPVNRVKRDKISGQITHQVSLREELVINKLLYKNTNTYTKTKITHSLTDICFVVSQSLQALLRSHDVMRSDANSSW